MAGLQKRTPWASLSMPVSSVDVAIVHAVGPPREPCPGPMMGLSGVDAYESVDSPYAVFTECTMFVSARSHI